jgi:predicted nucleotidyltransferase
LKNLNGVLLLKHLFILKKKTEILITDFLKDHIPGIIAIYIFGSMADNSATQESDIDIAFLTFQKISAVEKWKIQEEVASKLNQDVDLIDLKDATTILRTEVIEKGKLIFSGDSYQVNHFEMITYSMYADLNESRQDILTDYKEKYGRDSD